MSETLDKLTKVEFTNLDKIMYPALQITKRQVVKYYIQMAPKMLDILHNRPVVLTRFPNGVDQQGFYEKDAPQGTPSWVKTVRIYSETAEREIDYILCNDLDTLVWLANLAALEIHMTLCQAESFGSPDMLVFDMDPKPPATFADVTTVALFIKDRLDSLGLKSYPKTSGKKGMHILVPIGKGYSFKQTREFVQTVGESIKEQGGLIATEKSKGDIRGKVYIDYAQNSHGRTMISPYSLRATPDATVSTPLHWKEVSKGLKPESFSLLKMKTSRENPWKGIMEHKQKLKL